MINGDLYTAVTNDITINVLPRYLDDQSEPGKSYFVWAYDIEIINASGETVQLKERNWTITDANGHVEQVQGSGVVGEQPILKHGDSFHYTSGCPLPTSSGIMVGTYTMVTDTGETLEVHIPAFSLDLPRARITVN